MNMDIESFFLSIENSVLVSGSRDNKVIFWDTKTGQILKTIMIGRNLVCQIYFHIKSKFDFPLLQITDAKWSHDGTFIAQTGEDKENKYVQLLTYLNFTYFKDKIS